MPRIVFYLRIAEVSMLSEFLFEMSLKSWRIMAYTVCNAPEPMTSYFYYHSIKKLILMS